MQIVSIENSLHEMSNPVVLENKKMLSAENFIRVISLRIYDI